jgi:hypothetical protein
MWLEGRVRVEARAGARCIDVHLLEQDPDSTVSGGATDGGGGAFSWITLTAQELLAFAYSWKVQKVWLSLGSTTVWSSRPIACSKCRGMLYALEARLHGVRRLGGVQRIGT